MNDGNGLPKPLNSRKLWHWSFYNSSSSTLNGVIEKAKLGTVSRAANWKETKTPNAPEGFTDNSRQIWVENTKQRVRGYIKQLPKELESLGNVLYKPEQENKRGDYLIANNFIHKQSLARLKVNYPSAAPEKIRAMTDMVDIAIHHYWSAISPAIENGTPKSFDISGSEASKQLVMRGKNIDTRYWSREYLYLWRNIIEIIRRSDEIALMPLDRFIMQHNTAQRERQIEALRQFNQKELDNEQKRK